MKAFKFSYRGWKAFLYYDPKRCKPRGVLVMEICYVLEEYLKYPFRCPNFGRTEAADGSYSYTFEPLT